MIEAPLEERGSFFVSVKCFCDLTMEWLIKKKKY